MIRRGVNIETGISKEIRFHLSRLTLPDNPRRLACMVWPQQRGVFRQLYASGVVEVGIDGMADTGGILCDGRSLQLETKTPVGSLRDTQRRFRRDVEMFGAVYLVAHSKEEACAAILNVLGYPAPGALLNG